jgi:hypothetical protein
MKRRSLLGWLLGAPVVAALPEVAAKPVPYGSITRYTAGGVMFRYEWGELTEHQRKNAEAMAANFRDCVMDIWDDRDRNDYQTASPTVTIPCF